MDKEITKYNLRIPTSLYEIVKVLADNHGCSINTEMVSIIEDGIVAANATLGQDKLFGELMDEYIKTRYGHQVKMYRNILERLQGYTSASSDPPDPAK